MTRPTGGQKPGMSLQAVLDRQAAPDRPEPAGEAAPRRRSSREGTKLVAGHFAPAVAKELKLLAVEEETTIQALLEEAVDLLLAKYGKAVFKAPS